MKISVYPREGWYKVAAENAFGERSEYGSMPGDGVYEYLEKNHRLNRTFLEYWIVKNDREEDKLFREFLLRANDHRSPRRVRLEGWEKDAGLSYGEVPSKPKGPGDVVVYGDVARAEMKVIADDVGIVNEPTPRKRKLFGRI